jgi:Ca2+-binding EF-hand superfamily protein
MEVMVAALTEMRRLIVSNRVLLKPSFQDFDRTKSCHVTDQQFQRVLKNLALLPASDQVFDLIIRKYLDKNNKREVNYFAFCADVDRPEDMFPQLANSKREKTAPKPGSAPKTAALSASNFFYPGPTRDINVLENRYLQAAVHIAHDPSDVEQRLQAAVVMKRVRIEEFFRDFDKLRKGKVTVPQFRTVLSMLNFGLTEDEFQSLARKYDQDGHFGYAAFCANINLAFTQKGIDKEPTASVKPVTQDDTIAARRKYLEGTSEEEDQVFQYL